MQKKEKKSLIIFSFLEIFILIMGSISFAFIISKNIGFASAVEISISKLPSAEIPVKKNLFGSAINPTGAAKPTLMHVYNPGHEIIIDTTNVVEFAGPLGEIGFEKYPISKSIKGDFTLTKNADGSSIMKSYQGGETALTAQETQDFISKIAKNGLGTSSQHEFSLMGLKLTGATAHLVQGVVWAAAVVGAIQLIGNIAGLDEKLTNSLSIAAGAGILAAKAISALGPTGKNIITHGFFTQTAGKFLVGAAVAIAIFILTYKKEKQQIVNFQCLPWEPPIGGQKCEECNKDPLRPCSEYRCKSLGQACQLLNPGTKEEKCTWVNPRDVKSPVITASYSSLKPESLKYIPDSAIRPPAAGVKIVSAGGGCLPAFTPLQFGITTDEPAQCKIDYNHTEKFEQMQYYIGESNYYAYNHTEKIRLPGPSTEQVDLSPVLQNDGTFAYYVRCQDANGNQNVDEYVFGFCVDKGPDTTPPIIEGFSIPSGSPISFNKNSVNIDLYVNEPVECRWSKESKDYKEMENKMGCSTESYQINAQMQYVCSGNLTGIKNNEENKFYFRCKDQPSKPENERYVNTQSKELILKGSQLLNIISTKPNETIYGSTDSVQVNLEVETDDGAE